MLNSHSSSVCTFGKRKEWKEWDKMYELPVFHLSWGTAIIEWLTDTLTSRETQRPKETWIFHSLALSVIILISLDFCQSSFSPSSLHPYCEWECESVRVWEWKSLLRDTRTQNTTDWQATEKWHITMHGDSGRIKESERPSLSSSTKGSSIFLFGYCSQKSLLPPFALWTVQPALCSQTPTRTNYQSIFLSLSLLQSHILDMPSLYLDAFLSLELHSKRISIFMSSGLQTITIT